MAIYEEGYMIQLTTVGGRNIYLARVNMEGETFSLEWAENIDKALKFPISTNMDKIKIYHNLAEYWQEDDKVTCVLYRVTVDEVPFAEERDDVSVELPTVKIEPERKSNKYIRSLHKMLSAMNLILMNEGNGTPRTINDIAQAVGYKDSSGLGNVMKANLGINPSEFIKLSFDDKTELIYTLESVLL